MVADVGGTTTDVGCLRHGFPREANNVVDIGGVRTNFRMPDVLSIGLGGGSIVTSDPLAVGPVSVGYQLTEKARVFGGDTLTASDLAVAAGRIAFGDPARIADLDPAMVEQAMTQLGEMIAVAVDRMKPDAEPDPPDRSRRRRLPDPRHPPRHLRGRQSPPQRRRQRRRRGDRPDQRRGRPNLPRPHPRRRHRPRSRRRRTKSHHRRRRPRQPQGGRGRRSAAQLSAGQRAPDAGSCGGRRGGCQWCEGVTSPRLAAGQVSAGQEGSRHLLLSQLA